MLPHVLRSGTVAESAGSDSAGTAERRYPMSEVSGGGWEDQPHTVAARAQEGLEELSHIEGQVGRW